MTPHERAMADTAWAILAVILFIFMCVYGCRASAPVVSALEVTIKRIPQTPVYFAFNSIEPLGPDVLSHINEFALENDCTAQVYVGACSCGTEDMNEKVMFMRAEQIVSRLEVESEFGFIGIGHGEGNLGHGMDRRAEIYLLCPEEGR